jgi:hypothetical protein
MPTSNSYIDDIVGVPSQILPKRKYKKSTKVPHKAVMKVDSDETLVNTTSVPFNPFNDDEDGWMRKQMVCDYI